MTAPQPRQPRPGQPRPAQPHARQPLTDDLFVVLRRASRWAASGVPKTQPGQQGSTPTGCANPIVLFKFVLFFLLVVLMPLFILPMLVVRLIMFGPSALRFSAATDVVSGDAARWGHGELEPAADAAQIEQGLAAIASRDPEFRPARLTQWASAATALICQSLTSGDPAPTRTFMANGLFRSNAALLELRSQGNVSCEAEWVAVDASVVDAITTPLFDEVRVRLRCEGFCWEQRADAGLTPHSEAGLTLPGAGELTLRGGPDRTTWSEDLTFGRSSQALTPPAGGLPARLCPSCGAPLDLDYDGACRYCHGIVTAGRHDWVLTSWRREPW